MRKVEITKDCIEDIHKLDKRCRQWVMSIIDYLKDEKHTIEMIEQHFPMLSGGLHGFRKAKHRGFGLRILFRLVSNKRILVTIDRSFGDLGVDEIIQLFAVGHRDKIYDIVRKRIK